MLCESERERLAELLCELPALYARCESQLVNRRERGIELRVRGGAPGGIVLRDELVSARADIVSMLASWAALVVDERGVSGRPVRAVPALAAFLVAHLRWLQAHPAAGDAVAEFTEVAEGARAALGGGSVPLDLGPCSRPGCAAVILAGDDGVRCGDGHVVPPHDWLALRQRRAS
jgi:hypothetical protein